jgi:hypothetical protein
VNTAAAIAFTLVMLTGLGGISWNAWNNQRATHPTWPNRPLCTPCLIPTRHTENNNTWTRPLNRHELEHAWRTALFTQWQTELS